MFYLQFERGSRDAYIRLFSDNNILIEKISTLDSDRVKLDSETKNLTFNTVALLTEKETYYFVFDFGM